MSLSPNSNGHHAARFDPPRNIAPSPATFHALMNAPNGYSNFQQSFEQSQLLSPQAHSGALQHLPPASVSNMSDGQSPSSAGPTHRMSVGSSGHFTHHLQSDPTSPGSAGGPGSLFGDSSTGLPSTNPTNSSGAQNDADDAKNKDSKSDTMPSWAELKTKAGKERKRLPLACIACRRKKIRCSGEKPACKHCLRSRIPCVYKVTTRKAAPRTDYMAMLDKRLKRMEERVIKIVPKEDQARISTIGRAVVKPAIPGVPAKPPANDRKRAADTAFSDDLGEWSRSRPGTARKSSAAAANRAVRMGAEDQDENKLLQEGADSLPSKELQLHLAEVYFDFVYGQGYHLLHKPSFIRKLEAGQVPPVLVLAVCAISARFSSHPEVRTEPAFLRGEDWASAARDIALKRYDAPNITILIVYLLLGLHEFGTCQGGRSWMLGGMAQRMAYALQLHKDLDHDTTGRGKGAAGELTFTDREIRRRTMWACFMMDRFNSSGTERPIFVNEQFIQSQLPIKEHYFQFEIPGLTETLENRAPEGHPSNPEQVSELKENMGVAAYMIRLVAIWGQVIRYMNLGGKERDPQPMWSNESGFSTLRTSIRDWKSSLPSSLAWTNENLHNHASERIANQFIFLHIIHNQIVLFINRFALPSPGSRSSTVKDMPQAFVTECARTALEAANQISVLVNEAMDHRVVAPFAGYCAFFASTVHIYGVFSKNPALESSSKQNLAVNVKYLTKMKKHWGMFHFVTENLKDLYRKHADAAMRGPLLSTTSTGQKAPETIFQYGDWFDRYPNGVSGTDYEEPHTEIKKEPGSDAVLGQKSDLQSVEEFFSKLGPPSRTTNQKKAARKKRAKSDIQAPQATNADSRESAKSVTPSEVQNQQQHMGPPGPSSMPSQAIQRQAPYPSPAQQNLYAQGLSQDLAIMQPPRNPQHFPGIMSQPGGDMLASSFTAGLNQSQQSLHNSASFDNLNPSGNPFDMDLNAFNFGPSTGGSLWDQGSGWFLPFNMEPPSAMHDDSSIFNTDGGFDMAGLFGDLGGLGVGMGLDGPLAPPDGGHHQDFDAAQRDG